jgi:hypothetical protein
MKSFRIAQMQQKAAGSASFSSNTTSKQPNFDKSKLTTASHIARDHVFETEELLTPLTLSERVLFNINKENANKEIFVSVVLNDVSDLKDLPTVRYEGSGGVFSAVTLDPAIQAKLNERCIALEAIKLAELSAEKASTLFSGLASLDDQNLFRKTNFPQQVNAFIAQHPKVDGILKLMAMYQINHPQHVTEDPYLELVSSIKLLEKQTTHEVGHDIKTVKRYIFERKMDVPNDKVNTDDLSVKNFDAAAYNVIEAAKKLRATLNLKVTATDEEIAQAMEKLTVSSQAHRK